ncbi:MAG: hypothetical protein IPI56_11070 [Elusimicrobia bacterium]|nr:hypothetical protein [Elusimicrobiota bacterium]
MWAKKAKTARFIVPETMEKGFGSTGCEVNAMSENTTETIELTTPEVANGEVESKPTRGFERARMDERGTGRRREARMVAKEEVKEEKKEPVQEVVEPKEEPKAEEKVEEEVQEKKPTGLPDFTFKTPEQEKAWADALGLGRRNAVFISG